MPVFNRNRHSGSSGVVADHIIEQSCRFNDDDPNYTVKTFSGDGDSLISFSMSCWVKLGRLGKERDIFAAASGSGGQDQMVQFDASDRIKYQHNDVGGSGYMGILITNRVFRDVGAWYHILAVFDSANDTADSRMRLYVNGVEETSFGTRTNPDEDEESAAINNSTGEHLIGRYGGGGGSEWDGYIAEFVFIDGQSLTPTSFGKADSNGNWVPIDVSTLTFGTNGFHLNFANSSDYGNDVSGNNNDFTDSGFNTTDKVNDSPTDDATADPVVGNYCVMDSRFQSPSPAGTYTYADGNLLVTGNQGAMYGTIGVSSGKWYWEVLFPNVNGAAGVTSESVVNSADLTDISTGGGLSEFGGNDESYTILGAGGWRLDGSSSLASNCPQIEVGDRLGIALDLDNGVIWFSAEDAWVDFNGSDDSATVKAEIEAGTTTSAAFTGLSGTYFPIMFFASTQAWTMNFGQHAFTGSAPSGFKNICTANLPAPAIKDPSTAFQTTLYTGNGTAIGSGGKVVNQSGNSTFQPDLVWIKNRDATDQHILTDAARGVTKYLSSDGTDAQVTAAETLSTFDSDGFTVGDDVQVNTNTEDYVAWQWLAGGGAGSSNEAGSINTITTTVNTTAKFSVSTYTGTGSAATIGHGLGVAPEFIIVKNTADTDTWAVYHSSNTSAPETDFLILDTSAATADDATYWNDTAPTSSVFSIGTITNTNGSSDIMVAYCWAGIESYSKFGAYEGTASTTTGTFVWCGFRPAWIMAKAIDSTSGWYQYNSEVSPHNVINLNLTLDTTDDDNSADHVDFLSNGFKLRVSSDPNRAETLVFAAFAEFPLGGEGVAQARAR